MQNNLLSEIYTVTCHSQKVGTGSTFFAITGHKQEGKKYIHDALERGAKKIVIEENNVDQSLLDLCKQFGATLATSKNIRQELAHASAQAANFPAKKLKIIGITGTKGKTSTTFLIEHILKQTGHKTALIGGVCNKILNQAQASTLTTPNSDYLHIFFAECVKQQVEYVVMEVSSHALSLDRVYGVEFDVVGFTNLSSEHMDFYNSMEQYFAAKLKLFDQVKKDGKIIINNDDTWGSQAGIHAKKLHRQVISFKQGAPDNDGYHHFTITNNTLAGITLQLGQTWQLATSTLFGLFNAQNITMASLTCKQLGLPEQSISQALTSFPGVPGRLQPHQLKNGVYAFVDFAHSPGAMEQVLKTLRPFTHNLIVVFGCGGDRDTSKRPMMGMLAEKYADHIIITDDNPRTENRESIARDILQGINNQDRVTTILNRAEAIAQAASLATEGSIITLLGKGHETHYLINGEKKYFSDIENIRRY